MGLLWEMATDMGWSMWVNGLAALGACITLANGYVMNGNGKQNKRNET